MGSDFRPNSGCTHGARAAQNHVEGVVLTLPAEVGRRLADPAQRQGVPLVRHLPRQVARCLVDGLTLKTNHPDAKHNLPFGFSRHRHLNEN